MNTMLTNPRCRALGVMLIAACTAACNTKDSVQLGSAYVIAQDVDSLNLSVAVGIALHRLSTFNF